MRILLVSDIHDHLWRLQAVLAHAAAADVLICAGDLCSPFIMAALGNGFTGPVHVVFGNNDADLWRITANAGRFGERLHIHGELAEINLDGVDFAVNHYDNIGRALGASGKYDYVIFGHNHRREITVAGKTTLINPGTLMGVGFAAGKPQAVPATFALLDTQSREVAWYEVKGYLPEEITIEPIGEP